MIAKLGATSNNYGPSLAGLNHPFGIDSGQFLTIFRAGNWEFANFGIQSKKLVGGLEHEYYFPYIGNNHRFHFFRGGWNHQPEKHVNVSRKNEYNINQHNRTNINAIYVFFPKMRGVPQ